MGKNEVGKNNPSLDKGPKLDKDVELYFNGRTGLSGDSINAFMYLGNVDAYRPGSEREMWFNLAVDTPVPTYEEYLNKKQKPSIAEPLLKMSIPEKVVQFNELASRFNAERERIKQEVDYKAVIGFWEEAKKLILGQ